MNNNSENKLIISMGFAVCYNAGAKWYTCRSYVCSDSRQPVWSNITASWWQFSIILHFVYGEPNSSII